MNTAPVGSPNPWVQYVNNKDCSQGLCTLYCPQWCYIVFPPPSSPFSGEFADEGSGPNFSPFVITIIVVLAGAFLLVSYYAIVSKYCIRRVWPGSRENGSDDGSSVSDSSEAVAVVEPWFVPSNGLDEALIKSIEVFKYKRADNNGTDCIVCLSEFEEHDSLRRLPRCNHAFHIPCIDAWFKSHSTCPLCRSNVAAIEPSSMPPEGALSHGEIASVSQPLDTLIEIRDANEDEAQDQGSGHQHVVRRSASMDCIPDHRLLISVADGSDEGERERNGWREMKRSHSSGRWFFSKNGKHRCSIVPP